MITPLHHHIAKRTWNWLTRFRHRQGYGIHSPYAFNFVTGVVYESGHYYADAMLKKVYAQAQQRQGLRLKDCRLLFRLANFQQAHCCRLVGYDMKCLPVKFMQAACAHTRYVTDAQAMADMVVAVRHSWKNILHQDSTQMLLLPLTCTTLASSLTIPTCNGNTMW